MKTLLAFLIGVAAFIGVFCLDSIAINAIIDVIPVLAAEWVGLIRILLWIVAICLTAGIAIWVGVLVGVIIRILFD